MYIFLISAALVFLCIAFYDGVVERNYTLHSDKVNKAVKIVMISDLHSRYHGKNQEKLTERIARAKPDIIALVGDIFDGRKSDDGAICLIKNLPKDIPCFFVTGNHEHKTGKYKEYGRIMRENGICYLEEEQAHLKELNITVSGVSDPRKKEVDEHSYDMGAVIENKLSVDESEFNILLVHTPFHIEEYKKQNFDLVLSGHTHGGQVRIPFILNGLYSHTAKKRYGFFPNYCGGVYKHGGLTHIVGRGISNNPVWAPRVFNRREFVVVEIKNK